MRRDVLVVEDDADINAVVCELLNEERYPTRSVATLAAARVQLRASAPICVVLDLNLPDGSGEDLLVEMTRDGLGTPCVLMSASSDAPRVADRFGITLIRKPFELGALLSALGATIAGGISPRDGDTCLAS